jgi:hypothetical protein
MTKSFKGQKTTVRVDRYFFFFFKFFFNLEVWQVTCGCYAKKMRMLSVFSEGCSLHSSVKVFFLNGNSCCRHPYISRRDAVVISEGWGTDVV